MFKVKSKEKCFYTLVQRCPTHSPLATCGEWHFPKDFNFIDYYEKYWCNSLLNITYYLNTSKIGHESIYYLVNFVRIRTKKLKYSFIRPASGQ